MDRDKIIKFCQEYLEVNKYNDSYLNGLQVEGSARVSRIVTGVSLSEKLVREAIKRKAEMLIVHHGLSGKYIGNPAAQIAGFTRKRLKLILAKDINLCGFHLPLDGHPVIGNNASLARLLELDSIRPFACPAFGDIGFIGSFSKPVELDAFTEMVSRKLGARAEAIKGHAQKVKRVGVVSGSSPSDYQSAFAAGADTFLTGEIKESAVEQAVETGINYVWAGHYNTEKLGIRNLGNLLAKEFKVKVGFADVPCDI